MGEVWECLKMWGRCSEVLECRGGEGKCGERCVGMRTRVGGR